eukprot:gene49051-52546_t
MTDYIPDAMKRLMPSQFNGPEQRGERKDLSGGMSHGMIMSGGGRAGPPRFGVLPEWSQLRGVGVATERECWKRRLLIPDTAPIRSLRGTFWEIYFDWGSRFAALPFCAPKPIR